MVKRVKKRDRKMKTNEELKRAYGMNNPRKFSD